MTELFEKARQMTKEEIATLAVENDLVEDVYEILHFIIMARIGSLQTDLDRANADLRLIRKQETLCHEIVHGILVHIGRQDLSNDETLVQALGNAINQSFVVREVKHERDSN